MIINKEKQRRDIMNLLICFSLLTQLSQAINNSSVPTAVGKCKISIEKNKEKIYLFIFIY